MSRPMHTRRTATAAVPSVPDQMAEEEAVRKAARKNKKASVRPSASVNAPLLATSKGPAAGVHPKAKETSDDSGSSVTQMSMAARSTSLPHVSFISEEPAVPVLASGLSTAATGRSSLRVDPLAGVDVKKGTKCLPTPPDSAPTVAIALALPATAKRATVKRAAAERAAAERATAKPGFLNHRLMKEMKSLKWDENGSYSGYSSNLYRLGLIGDQLRSLHETNVGDNINNKRWGIDLLINTVTQFGRAEHPALFCEAFVVGAYSVFNPASLDWDILHSSRVSDEILQDDFQLIKTELVSPVDRSSLPCLLTATVNYLRLFHIMDRYEHGSLDQQMELFIEFRDNYAYTDFDRFHTRMSLFTFDTTACREELLGYWTDFVKHSIPHNLQTINRALNWQDVRSKLHGLPIHFPKRANTWSCICRAWTTIAGDRADAGGHRVILAIRANQGLKALEGAIDWVLSTNKPLRWLTYPYKKQPLSYTPASFIIYMAEWIRLTIGSGFVDSVSILLVLARVAQILTHIDGVQTISEEDSVLNDNIHPSNSEYTYELGHTLVMALAEALNKSPQTAHARLARQFSFRASKAILVFDDTETPSETYDPEFHEGSGDSDGSSPSRASQNSDQHRLDARPDADSPPISRGSKKRRSKPKKNTSVVDLEEDYSHRAPYTPGALSSLAESKAVQIGQLARESMQALATSENKPYAAIYEAAGFEFHFGVKDLTAPNAYRMWLHGGQGDDDSENEDISEVGPRPEDSTALVAWCDDKWDELQRMDAEDIDRTMALAFAWCKKQPAEAAKRADPVVHMESTLKSLKRLSLTADISGQVTIVSIAQYTGPNPAAFKKTAVVSAGIVGDAVVRALQTFIPCLSSYIRAAATRQAIAATYGVDLPKFRLYKSGVDGDPAPAHDIDDEDQEESTANSNPKRQRPIKSGKDKDTERSKSAKRIKISAPKVSDGGRDVLRQAMRENVKERWDVVATTTFTNLPWGDNMEKLLMKHHMSIVDFPDYTRHFLNSKDILVLNTEELRVAIAATFEVKTPEGWKQHTWSFVRWTKAQQKAPIGTVALLTNCNGVEWFQKMKDIQTCDDRCMAKSSEGAHVRPSSEVAPAVEQPKTTGRYDELADSEPELPTPPARPKARQAGTKIALSTLPRNLDVAMSVDPPPAERVYTQEANTERAPTAAPRKPNAASSGGEGVRRDVSAPPLSDSALASAAPHIERNTNTLTSVELLERRRHLVPIRPPRANQFKGFSGHAPMMFDHQGNQRQYGIDAPYMQQQQMGFGDPYNQAGMVYPSYTGNAMWPPSSMNYNLDTPGSSQWGRNTWAQERQDAGPSRVTQDYTGTGERARQRGRRDLHESDEEMGTNLN